MKSLLSESSSLSAEKIINGERQWTLNGALHRVDGPAVEKPDGTKQWWHNGKLNRVDGPAFEGVDGTKEWYFNGELHRVDGPAVEWADGSKGWWLNGKQHRVDGPAIERADGTVEWCLQGKRLAKSRHPYWIEQELLKAIEKSQATSKSDTGAMTDRVAKPKARSI